jgi:hypothetical protein
MDNYKKLSEELLKKDGIDPANIPDSERTVFRQLLDKHFSPGQTKPALWRIIMKSKITKLAAAAAVFIACLICISVWRTTGSGIALGDVLTHMEQIKAYRYTGTMTFTGQENSGNSYHQEMRFNLLASQDNGAIIRRERIDPNGRSTLILEEYRYPQKKNVVVRIQHINKTYTREEPSDNNQIKMFNQDHDPASFLKGIMSCKHASIGRSTLDGVEVEVFGTTDPNYLGTASRIENLQFEQDGKVWIDVKKRLPVRCESLLKRLDANGNPMTNSVVLYDFRWDIPVTSAEFEPPPAPDGYLIVVDNLPGPLTEEGIIQGLKQCVSLLGRYPYPENINMTPPRGIQLELNTSDSPAATKLKDELKVMTKQDRVNRLMEVGTPMRRIYRFCVGLLASNKDPGYYGKIITPKDADKVLMRWKVSENEYRVIYGDLHAESVTKEKLAELEAVLPK